MKRLIWSGPARSDLFSIAAYYGRIDPTLPDLILQRIEEAPLVLLDFPKVGSPTRNDRVRKWRVPKTPFVLFYAEHGDDIQIRRVVHDRLERLDGFMAP
ncbi:type II toxin-antitoxin system RelE/ParE family toxin [Sphingomonas koreensis]|nr:type II toxin-antitoxin system RelE/ParE family toxin [Sphingomonas koreensis]